MSDHGWIVVERWDEFQHLDVTRNTSGAPPWIKNYTRLLDDDEYLSLTVHTSSVLHRLWLLYAKSRCALRADTAQLSRRLGLRVTKSHLESLNHAGFISFSTRKPHAGDVEGTRDEHVSARPGEEVEVEVEEPPTHLAKGHSGRVGGDQHKDFALPSPIDRPELEPDNGVSRLSPHEELLLKKGNAPF